MFTKDIFVVVFLDILIGCWVDWLGGGSIIGICGGDVGGWFPLPVVAMLGFLCSWVGNGS